MRSRTRTVRRDPPTIQLVDDLLASASAQRVGKTDERQSRLESASVAADALEELGLLPVLRSRLRKSIRTTSTDFTTEYVFNQLLRKVRAALRRVAREQAKAQRTGVQIVKRHRPITASWGRRLVGSIGDVNPLAHGGGLIYRSTRYKPAQYELDYIEPPEEDFDDEDARWTVYRVDLEIGELHPSWEDYDTQNVADSIEMDHEEFLGHLRSREIIRVASAVEAMAGYYGWGEFDLDPLVLTRAEVSRRYRSRP